MVTVLLAEDDNALSLLLKFRLEREGYGMIIAKNGLEAMQQIAEATPDIILADIMMPFASGLEVTSHVRNELKLDVPIVLFSSAGQEKMVMEAFNLGASDFMSKPFNPNELLLRMKRLLMDKSIPRNTKYSVG